MSAAAIKPTGWILASVLVTFSLVSETQSEEPKLADYFGFQPLEIYKLDSRIGNLLIKDLDGDKTDDIAVVNNGRSRIDLLLSSKKKGKSTTLVEVADEPNQIRSDLRMRLVSVPVNKEVGSLQAADLNSDGRVDLAFYGKPSEIVVLFGDEDGEFSETKRINVGEGTEGANALTVGDLNRDGRVDLALLGDNQIQVVYQGEGGTLGEPERIPHTAGDPQMIKAIDLDGDGGVDLVILDGGNEDPIRVRFTNTDGKLGPEQRFYVESPRAIAFFDVDKKPGMELLTVESQSGRARVLKLEEAERDESGNSGRLNFYPLPAGSERGRALALGDLDGDGKVDVVVTDPSNAQLLLYRQSGKTGLGSAQSFPSLVGGRNIRLVDLDKDGKDEVVVLSEQEKQIGRSVLEGSRLTFPTPLPISGEPIVLDVADLDNDKSPEVLYIARDKANGTDTYSLRAIKRDSSGKLGAFRWGEEESVVLKDLSNAPSALQVIDANRDGQPDVLVFNAFGPPLLLLGRSGGEPPAPAGGSLGPLAGVTPTGLTLAQLDGPALFVAQNTFARNLLLDKEGRWEVKDQYNSGRSSAQIIGAVALDIEGDGKKEVVLLDKVSKSLLVLESKEGVYRPKTSIVVGSFDFQGMHVADLDGDGHEDLLLAGTDRFGVLLTGQMGLRFKPIASYESAREDAKMGDLIAGDLNGDGLPDLVLADIAEHFIEIVTATKTSELRHAFAFKVFERKSFRDLNDLVEPRDLGVGDVDGDGLSDLILIVHDRVLVYRQDAGGSDKLTDH